MFPELVILCGVQGSGKTTFRRGRFPGHVVVSKDLMRNNRRKELRQRELVEHALAAGESVVVDNTNPARADRAPLIAIGRELDAKVVGFYFDVDLAVCMRRNAARSGRDLVPRVGLLSVARRLEAPTSEEGFDELWLVRPPEGRFEAEPMGVAVDPG